MLSWGWAGRLSHIKSHKGQPAWHLEIRKEPTAVGGQAGTQGSWILTLALTPEQSPHSPGLTVTFPFLFEKIASTDFFVSKVICLLFLFFSC